MTIGETWQMEKEYLLPLPERDMDCCRILPVRVNGYSQVEFETNRYSVPADEVERNLLLKAYPFRIKILRMDKVIATHPRCYRRHQEVIDPLHYLPLLEKRPGAFQHAKPIRLKLHLDHPQEEVEEAEGDTTSRVGFTSPACWSWRSSG
ncbi:hypothetical protein J7M22_08000 [Candidatus Poribacteria bacterium]|nr:hypothetical protein [Candidatus Poribacteria bacterium]